MPGATRAYMGLGVSNGCIISEYGMNIRMQNMFIAPLPIWSHVGLGSYGNRCIWMQRMIIAPLPIRSYVGLGLISSI